MLRLNRSCVAASLAVLAALLLNLLLPEAAVARAAEEVVIDQKTYKAKPVAPKDVSRAESTIKAMAASPGGGSRYFCDNGLCVCSKDVNADCDKMMRSGVCTSSSPQNWWCGTFGGKGFCLCEARGVTGAAPGGGAVRSPAATSGPTAR